MVSKQLPSASKVSLSPQTQVNTPAVRGFKLKELYRQNRNLLLSAGMFLSACGLSAGCGLALATFSPISPNKDLLADIVTVSAGLLAIAVPLGFTVLTLIGSHYKSYLISRMFGADFSVRVFAPLLSIVLIVALILRAISVDMSKDFVGKACVFGDGCLFLFLILNFLWLLWLVLQFMEPHFLSRRISRLWNIGKGRGPVENRSNWIDGLLSFSDLLIAEAERGNFLFAISQLGIISKLPDKLHEYYSSSQKDFELFLYSEDYAKRYVALESAEEKWKMYSDEQHLSSIHALFLPFRRLFTLAIAQQNDDLKRETIFHFVSLVIALRSNECTNSFHHFGLLKLKLMQLEAIEQNDLQAFYYVCDRFRNLTIPEGELDRGIINLILKNLFIVARKCIDTGRLQHFTVLFQSLIMQTSAYSWSQELLSKATNTLSTQFHDVDQEFNLGELLKWTGERANTVYDEKELAYCWEKLIFVESILKTKVDESPTRDKLLTDLNTMRSSLKEVYLRAGLLQLCAEVASYCWYYKKLDFIRALWDQHHRRNSAAVWTGRDLLPQDLTEYFTLICFSEHFFSGRRWTANAEDTYQAMSEYMVAVLIKILQESNNRKFTLPSFESKSLQRFGKHSLNILSKALSTFSLQKQDLEALGLMPKAVSEVMTTEGAQLIGMARHALSVDWQANNLGPISHVRIQQFWSEFQDAYRRGRMRQLLLNHNKIRDYSAQPSELNPTHLVQHSIGRVVASSNFAEDVWFQFESGKHWGRLFSFQEDVEVINTIVAKARVVSATDLKSEGLHRTWVAFSMRNVLMHPTNSLRFSACIDASLPGHYAFVQVADGLAIPVFSLTDEEGDVLLELGAEYKKLKAQLQNDLLLFDGNNVGEFLQYAPTFETEFKIGSMATQIVELRKDPALVDKLLKDHSQYLVNEFGSLDAAKTELVGQMYLNFEERFKFVVSGGARILRVTV